MKYTIKDSQVSLAGILSSIVSAGNTHVRDKNEHMRLKQYVLKKGTKFHQKTDPPV